MFYYLKMENSKNIFTTGALIIIVMVLASLASSALAVSHASEVHRNRKLAQIMIGRPGENCVPKGQHCGILDPCCAHLECTNAYYGTCVCLTEGAYCALQGVCCEGLYCPYDGLRGNCKKINSPAIMESGLAKV